MKIEEFIDRTNFADLRDQKSAVLQSIAILNCPGYEDIKEKLDGLLSFLDAFQDMAVDEYGVPAEKVFGRDGNNE
jgi:hypothetical protein